MSVSEPWGRQEHEGGRAYGAFQCYLRLGTSRSYARVGQTLGKSKALIERWGTKYGWQIRAQAYDDNIAHETLVQMRTEVLDMNKRHIAMAHGLQTKAVARLQSIDIENLSPKDVVIYFEAAIKIERLARGEVTDRLAQQNIEIPIRKPDGEDDAVEGDRIIAVAHELMALGVFDRVIEAEMAKKASNGAVTDVGAVEKGREADMP